MRTLNLKMTACAFAAAALLTACGGGGTTPDTTAPTLTITDNVEGTATSDVTFTFTFNEAVGSTFVAEDIMVVGGTAGTLTKVSETVYTMVVTPTENSSGTMSVGIAASKFSDLSKNQNTAETTALQVFDTRTNTPTDEGTVLANFDDVNPAVEAYEGADTSAVEASPSGGSTGNSFKVLRSGGTNYALGIVNATVPLASNRRVISARVYSPTAGIPMVVKLEGPDGANTGDTQVNETVIAGWQTLTWTFSGADVSKTYTKIVLLPNLGTVDPAPGKAYYFDDLNLLPASSGGSQTATTLTFSSGFAASSRTVDGGEFGGFSGSNLDGYSCNDQPANCGGGGDFAPGTAAEESSFYYYYQTTTPASDLYAGIYIMSPGVTGGLSATGDTSGIQINGQTKLNFTFNQNPEWYNSSTKNFMIDMDLGKRYVVNGNGCHLQLRRVVTPTSENPSNYSIPLSSFTLVQNCGMTGMTVAAALAASPVSQINFKGVGGAGALSDGRLTSGANLNVINTQSQVYPTTLALKGSITFD